MISVDNELCYLGFEQFAPTTVIQSDVAYAASAEFSAGEYQKIIDSGTNVSVETERMVDRIDPSQRITITALMVLGAPRLAPFLTLSPQSRIDLVIKF